MRHRVDHRKLNRAADQRMALLRSLARSLLVAEENKVVTTEAKAKEVRRLVEELITLAKTDDVHSRRLAARILGHQRQLPPWQRKTGRVRVDPIRKLFETIGPNYADRPGGYCRITRIGLRRGDAAPMAVIELV